MTTDRESVVSDLRLVADFIDYAARGYLGLALDSPAATVDRIIESLRAGAELLAPPPVDVGEEGESESRCPACGDFIDYCQGHGEIGDPVGAVILRHHDNDNHAGCHWLSDCKEDS